MMQLNWSNIKQRPEKTKQSVQNKIKLLLLIIRAYVQRPLLLFGAHLSVQSKKQMIGKFA